MTTTTTNKETIAKAFDTTHSALQTICKDFEQRRVIRSKDLFLEEQNSNAEEVENDNEQYYGL